MWVLDYYFSLWNHLKGENVTDLYDPLKALADSEKTKVLQLFENTIDQVSFNTTDYQRLKDFLVDWYSSFRTITTSESNASDPLSLPNSDLDELFRSFGYPYSNQLSLLNNKINTNKVNFFLDLVNLYKVKGTPESILKVFSYYGIHRAEIIEYFLKRNPYDCPSDELIFTGDVIAYTGNEITLPQTIKPYDAVTVDDPHWFYTKDKILNAIENTRIKLPSKSPYFSLRIFYDMSKTQATTSLISRKITDDYNNWLSSGIKPSENAFITYFGTNTSFLELYLINIYIFNTRNRSRPIVPERYSHYTQDPSDDYDNIINDYMKLHNDGLYTYHNPITGNDEEIPLTRETREEELQNWYDNFSQEFILSFLKDPVAVANVLNVINPSLKSRIDEIIDIYPFVDLFGPFISDLQNWINSYMGGSLSNLSFLILGEEEVSRSLGHIINFFKPYHARMISVDLVFLSEDRLTDSILLDDPLVEKIVEYTWDYATCDGSPCCPESNENDICENVEGCGDYNDNVYVDSELRGKRHYARGRYDCGSFYDVGVSCDSKPGAYKLIINDTYTDRLTCRNTLVTEEPYEEISFVEDPVTHEWITVKTTIPAIQNYLTTEFIETLQYNVAPQERQDVSFYTVSSGGFVNFDDGGCFDCNYGNDVCEILVLDY